MKARYWSMSVILGGLIVAGTAWAALDCGVRPTCAELGYTDTADKCDDSGMLKCPFDETAVFCREKLAGTGCEMGSVLYSDLKCYDPDAVPSGLTAIGVVFDIYKKLAVALDESKLPWYDGDGSYEHTNAHLEMCPIDGIETCGVNGKRNTMMIVDLWGYSNNYAAGYCYNYTTPGVVRTNWFLPDDATMTKMMNSVSTLNWVLENIASAEEIGGTYHASQSDADYKSSNCLISDSSPWRIKSSGCGSDRRSYGKHSRCVINYTDIVVPTPKTCEIGDVVYDDLKCYTLEPEGVTAIGIAVDPSQRLMLGLNGFDYFDPPIVDGTLSWEGANQNSLGLRKVLDVNEDLQQKACTEYEVRAGTCSTDAKAVTAMFASEDAVLEWLKPIVEEKYHAIGSFKFTDFYNGAPDYCLNYSTAGTSKGDWFIPAADTWIKVFENYDLIESVLTEVGGTKIRGSKYSKSTSYWSTTVTKMPEKETDNVDYGFFAVSMNFEDKYITLRELQPDGWVYVVDARCVARY